MIDSKSLAVEMHHARQARIDAQAAGSEVEELIWTVQHFEPGKQRMVFMTGGVSMDRAREFLATCPNLTLEKPFDFERLRRTLRQLVQLAREATPG